VAISIQIGSALACLRAMPADSVHCCVTSPPYYGLRDYGVSGQIGLEKSPDEYIAALVAVFREVRRVLRKDGTLWLNIGDSYASLGQSRGGPPSKHSTLRGNGHIGGGPKLESLSPVQVAAAARNPAFPGNTEAKDEGSRSLQTAYKPKDLLMIPAQLALALRADGWWLRRDIIWSKPNPMPESVRDRPTSAHEYLFLLSKTAHYYYDGEAIKEPSVDPAGKSRGGSLSRFGRSEQLVAANAHRGDQEYSSSGTRNKRSVWTIATSPYPEAHFATFPPALVEPCILAGTSARGVCPKCEAPWYSSNATIGWRPSCSCNAGDPIPATVCDPFLGAGTTALVADRLGRDCIGIELNPAYAAMAERRISAPKSTDRAAAKLRSAA
jgi:DNA modification methylase